MRAGLRENDAPEPPAWSALLHSFSELCTSSEEKSFLSARLLKARTHEVEELYQELMLQRDQLAAALASMSAGFAYFDDSGYLLLVNSLALELLGISSDSQESGHSLESLGLLRFLGNLKLSELGWEPLSANGMVIRSGYRSPEISLTLHPLHRNGRLRSLYATVEELSKARRPTADPEAARLRQENQALQRRLQSVEEDLRSSRQVRKSSAELDALRPQMEGLVKQNQRYESAFAQAKQRMTAYSQELAQRQHDCEILSREKIELESQLLDYQRQVADLGDKLKKEQALAESRREQRSAANEEIRSRSSENSRLQAEMESLAQEKSALESKLQGQSDSHAKLLKDLEESRRQLNESRKLCAESQQLCAAKDAQLRELRQTASKPAEAVRPVEVVVEVEKPPAKPVRPPAPSQPPAPVAPPPSEPAPPAAPVQALKVLLVEDEPISLLVTQECIESLGHQCIIAEDGNEALKWVQRQPVDAVITSYHMPGINGVTLCRKMQALASENRPYFILLTSMEKPEEVSVAREAGIDAILLKPLNVADLESHLHRAGRRNSK